MLSYNLANKQVAILCNHQRAIPKTFAAQKERMEAKIEEHRKLMKKTKKDLKEAKKEKDKTTTKRLEAKIETQKKKMVQLDTALQGKEEMKNIALGTSKLNYLDPRISVAWSKRHEVPIEKIYNKTQRDKFAWAMDFPEDFVF